MRSHFKILAARCAAAACFALTGHAAMAVDGVVLIDQNKALAGNVTPGDTPGFPVTITQAGSYRLSGNLTVPDANTSAIVIAADVVGVTIDLNGFAIVGPTVCSGFPLTCSPSGTGNGVFTAGARAGTVRNGTVVGMGGTGVSMGGAGSSVENVTATSNGGHGIYVALGTATHNRVIKNRLNGVLASNALITHTFASQNAGAGIGGNDSLFTQNTLVVNGGVGIAASNSAFLSNQFSSNNGGAANPQFNGRNAIGPNGCDGSTCP
ncbi:MAG: hypothetical protein ABIN96_05650 [Rubrivivax sp.]